MKIVSPEDVLSMLDQCGYTNVQMQENACLAYSLSKMLVIDEMNGFDKYNEMKLCEFFEFLGRFAELTYEGNATLA